LLVAEQLPADNPVKKSALRYTGVYEKAYGAGSVSTFGGHAWDAGLLLENAVPTALKKPSREPKNSGQRCARR
jgi:branched-chain amino acid transport system substrate-binding protein